MSTFVILWAVIDPIGTVPVFISVTGNATEKQRRKIAFTAAITAAGILLFFLILGELVLKAMGVPLLAFQIAGGIVLFLFALSMIFGESKPEEELKIAHDVHEKAIFPLATPSLASPGAMMAIVLLTDNQTRPIQDQIQTAIVMMIVVGIAYLFMLGSNKISAVIGSGGASIISRVMGMILASVAASNVLEGIKQYFHS